MNLIGIIKYKDTTQAREIRVIGVIPGKREGFSMIFSKRQVKSLRKAGVKAKDFFLYSRTNPFILFKEFIRLWYEIKNFHPDIIHAHYGTMTAFVCAISSFINRIPLVITFRGSDLNKTSIDGFLRDLMGRILSQFSALRAAGIICVSRKLREKLWWNKNLVEVIPVGVDVEFFCPVPKNKARILLKWKLDGKVVLFNAHNPKVKRLDIAEASITEAKRYIPNIHLEALKGDILPEKMPFYLNASDCLLVTSDSEGSPNIVKEGLACNLPVVSVDVGDIPDRIDGVFPSMIVERNPKALGKAIVEILEMDCRSNGRSIIQEQLSEEKITRKIIGVYKKITNMRQ